MGLQKFLNFVKNTEATLLNILQTHWNRGAPALALAHGSHLPITHPANRSPDDTKSLLETIVGDGFLWAAVPKARVSWERRNLRKHGRDKMRRWVEPRKNLNACLKCGHWHMAHTICGNCYEKVKQETEVMKNTMGEIEYHYNAPRKEVVYLYEGEEDLREQHGGKYIVEMNRDRPTWWQKHMLTKANQ